MKRLFLLLLVGAALLAGAELSAVHAVYVLPMGHGLDQYLAHRLTDDHVFQVVTDPKLADAVLTDHLGEAFQSKIEDFSPTPEPAKPAAKEENPGEAKPGEAKPGDLKPDDAASTLANAAGASRLTTPGGSSFGRGKGVVFLVDVKSRQVVWSAFELPKNSTASELERTASDIVSRLKKDLNPHKK